MKKIKTEIRNFLYKPNGRSRISAVILLQPLAILLVILLLSVVMIIWALFFN